MSSPEVFNNGNKRVETVQSADSSAKQVHEFAALLRKGISSEQRARRRIDVKQPIIEKLNGRIADGSTICQVSLTILFCSGVICYLQTDQIGSPLIGSGGSHLACGR